MISLAVKKLSRPHVACPVKRSRFEIAIDEFDCCWIGIWLARNLTEDNIALSRLSQDDGRPQFGTGNRTRTTVPFVGAAKRHPPLGEANLRLTHLR